MANQRIYTVGYGGRHPDEFLELLRSHQITRIIDVRDRPAEASMRLYKKAKRPDRGIEGLLDRASISYSHFLELGNLFRGLEDWEQGYRALIQAAGPLLLDRLRQIDEPYCLLCAEKDAANCHRCIIADAIAREGHSVTQPLTLYCRNCALTPEAMAGDAALGFRWDPRGLSRRPGR